MTLLKENSQLGESASKETPSVWTPRTHRKPLAADLHILSRAAVVLLVLAMLAISYTAREVLIPTVLALLLSLVLSPLVTMLERCRVPRGAGSLLVVVAVLAALGFGITLIAEPARDWMGKAPATIHTLQDRFAGFREPLRQVQEASKSLEDLQQPATKPIVVSQPGMLMGIATGTPKFLGAVAALFLLTYFFLSSGNGFLRRLVEIAPKLRDKKLVVSIARDIQREMSSYLLMVSAINVALGAMTATVLYFIGVPSPLLWGAVAFLFNFAPYVGPAITGACLLVVGITTFPDLAHALVVPGAFFFIAFVEGQLITPTLIGKKLALDPAVVFVWLVLWGWLWGIVGVLLAGPLIACLRILCRHIEALNAIGVLISDGAHAVRVQEEN
jgi:predicted PurR-regulated permease PerM